MTKEDFLFFAKQVETVFGDVLPDGIITIYKSKGLYSVEGDGKAYEHYLRLGGTKYIEVEKDAM